MKIASVLDRIDSGAIALPEFQRGYVWHRRQVRDLVESLYRRFPVGSLLLWQTETESTPARGDARLQPGFVALLLDGQQRITSLYGLIRGVPPPFFDGDAAAFADLRFHVEAQRFQFYAPVTMRDDPLWIDVSKLLQHGMAWAFSQLQSAGDASETLARHHDRLNQLYTIRDVDLHAEEITGSDKTVDVVVELFNRVNTGGTKLSKGDIALAKLCASWPQARGELKQRLGKWERAGFHFTLDWLLRNVNAVATGRAEFAALERVRPEAFRRSLVDAERSIDVVLNLISTRLGLDHDRVLGAVGALPLMTCFVVDRDCRLDAGKDADRLLFWYVHCLLWGRYAGSTETVLNVDLQQIRDRDPTSVERLVDELRRRRGELRVTALDFDGWSRGARFYPLLYLLSRVHGARDLGSGIELKNHLLGQHSALEVHHIFPKALLYRNGYSRPEVNALGNFTFLTLDTNRALGGRSPAEYLATAEKHNPGVLGSNWIPADPGLRQVEQYVEFLAARRELLAEAANGVLDDLWGWTHRRAGRTQPTRARRGPGQRRRRGDGAAGQGPGVGARARTRSGDRGVRTARARWDPPGGSTRPRLAGRVALRRGTDRAAAQRASGNPRGCRTPWLPLLHLRRRADVLR